MHSLLGGDLVYAAVNDNVALSSIEQSIGSYEDTADTKTLFGMLQQILSDVLIVIDLVGHPATDDDPATGLYAEVTKTGNDTLILDITNALNNMLVGGSQLVTESCDWVVPDGVYAVYLSGLGGGGGGGAGGNCYFVSMYGWAHAYAGGGGGGGYSSGVLDKVVSVTPGSTVHITIGAGGTSGCAGGATLFGDYLSIPGGSAGGSGGNVSMDDEFHNCADVPGGAAGSIGGSVGPLGSYYIGNNGYYTGGSGAGGVPSTFYSQYGAGGHGGSGGRINTGGNMNAVYPTSYGSAGASGQSGCLLICWGDFRYSNVYPD